jgi:hypothetical protein
MAEHSDFWLWNRSPEPAFLGADDYALDPDVLGVSPRLTKLLTAWNDRFNVGSPDSPGAQGPSSAWEREGWLLAQDLQREFDGRGLDVEVTYQMPDGGAPPVRGRPYRPVTRRGRSKRG